MNITLSSLNGRTTLNDNVYWRKIVSLIRGNIMSRCLSCNAILTEEEQDNVYAWDESIDLCFECLEETELSETSFPPNDWSYHEEDLC